MSWITGQFFHPLWTAVYQKALAEASRRPDYDPYRAGRHLWSPEKERQLFRELFDAALPEAARNGQGTLTPEQILDAGLNFFRQPEMAELGIVPPGLAEAEARRAIEVQAAVDEVRKQQQLILSPLALWRARGGRFAWETDDSIA